MHFLVIPFFETYSKAPRSADYSKFRTISRRLKKLKGRDKAEVVALLRHRGIAVKKPIKPSLP